MFSRLLTALIALAMANMALACKPVTGNEPFTPEIQLRTDGKLSPPPEISIVSILRGYGGSGDSCAWLGMITFGIPVSDAGYRFEIVEGSFAHDPPFPEGWLHPGALMRNSYPGQMSFFWNDESVSPQEPIDILVKITSISRDGRLSEPLFLAIEDAGGFPAQTPP